MMRRFVNPTLACFCVSCVDVFKFVTVTNAEVSGFNVELCVKTKFTRFTFTIGFLLQEADMFEVK